MYESVIDELIKEINKPITSFGLESIYDSLMKMNYWILLLYALSEYELYKSYREFMEMRL